MLRVRREVWNRSLKDAEKCVTLKKQYLPYNRISLNPLCLPLGIVGCPIPHHSQAPNNIAGIYYIEMFDTHS